MLSAKDTESKIEDKTFNESDFEVMNALQFTKVMGNGINLGNTMEAAGFDSVRIPVAWTSTMDWRNVN